MSQTAATPSGWYPDPWQVAPLRYYDGVEWTPHTNGPPQSFNVNAADRDPAKLRKVVGWAGWAIFANTMTAFTFPLLFNSLQELLDNATTASQVGGQVQMPAQMTVAQLLSLVSYAALVAWMVFTYRATSMAKALGRPVPRDGALACCGWIIPFVNFWWPYTSLRALSNDPKTRTKVGWFWFGYLGSILACAVVSAFVLGGLPVIAAIGICFVILVSVAWLGRSVMIDITNELSSLSIGQEHAR